MTDARQKSRLQRARKGGPSVSEVMNQVSGRSLSMVVTRKEKKLLGFSYTGREKEGGRPGVNKPETFASR